LEELAGFLAETNGSFQLAPAWTASELDLHEPALPAGCFHIIRENGRITGCAALWDQRAFRQTVVRGYTPLLSAVRPAFNVLARVLGAPRLPRIGQSIANGFVSHLATTPGQPGRVLDCIAACRTMAARAGLDLLTLGFAANDPRLAPVKRAFRHREYRSRIYAVRWPGIGGSAGDLDNRILAPEVATL
jgi:hypothetical protein